MWLARSWRAADGVRNPMAPPQSGTMPIVATSSAAHTSSDSQCSGGYSPAPSDSGRQHQMNSPFRRGGLPPRRPSPFEETCACRSRPVAGGARELVPRCSHSAIPIEVARQLQPPFGNGGKR